MASRNFDNPDKKRKRGERSRPPRVVEYNNTATTRGVLAACRNESQISHEVFKQVVSDICLCLDPRWQPPPPEGKLDPQEVLNLVKPLIRKKKKKMRVKMHKMVKFHLEKAKERREERRKERRWWEKVEESHIGKTYNMLELLSSEYLITSNHEQVKTDQICGKYVLLCFYVLCDGQFTPRFTQPTVIHDLEDIYTTHKDDFEVVFVALGNNKHAFDSSFSTMPWLAIPHEFQQSRDSLKEEFDLRGGPCVLNAVLFNPQGTILQMKTDCLIKELGPEAFPFSKPKIDQIWIHDPSALWEQLILKKQSPSLTSLVGKYVYSSKRKKVLTSKFEAKKTVGLYFFQMGPTADDRTTKLLQIWRTLKEDRRHKDFEIVFINADRQSDAFFSEDYFEKRFGCENPWYTVPSNGRILSWLFRLGHDKENVPEAGYLIVLEPDRFAPLSYFAFSIMQQYGPQAYPFTLESAVRISSACQKNLQLSNILGSSATLSRGTAPPSTHYKEACTTTVSELSGMRVLLLFARHSCVRPGTFLSALMRKYNQQRGTDDPFEIIYISLDESQSNFNMSIKEMPWFVHPFHPDRALLLLQSLFYCEFCHLPAVVAFGQDGMLETKESSLNFIKEWNSSYPFIEEDMTEEVGKELMSWNKWDLASLQYVRRH